MKTTTVVLAILLIMVFVEAKKGKNSKEKEDGLDPKHDPKHGEKGSKEHLGEKGSKEKSGEKGSKETSGEKGSKEKSGEKGSKEKSEEDSKEDKSIGKPKSGEQHSGENGQIHLTITIDSSKYVYRSSSNTYIIYDIKTNIYIMMNAKTHVMILINLNYDYEIMTLIYLDQKSSRAVWKSDSFEDFLSDALEFSSVYHVSQQYGLQFFELQTITKEVIQNIREILITFAPGYSSNNCQTFISVLQVAVRTSFFYQKSLKGFEKIISSSNSAVIEINHDYQWWNGFWGGVATFCKWAGGAEHLAKQGVKIDLQKAATQPSGIHSLGNLLVDVVDKVDFNIFYKNINSELGFFKLATKLDGRDKRGFRGFLKLLTTIIAFNFDRASEQTLLFYWIQIFRNKNGNFENLEQQWKNSIQFIVGVFEKYKLQESLSNMYEVLISIQKNEWKEQTINMTQVMVLLFKTAKKAPNVTDEDFNDLLKLIDRS